MSSSTFQRLFTLENLRIEWKVFFRSVGSRQRSFGVDGVTPADFQERAERNLTTIHNSIQRGYVFSPLRAHLVEKPDGRKRVICIPTVAGRVVQRVIVSHLTSQAQRLGILNAVSYGFIKSSDEKKRGVVAARDHALQLRRSYRWAYKSDIQAFFDRIPREIVVQQVVRRLRTPSLRDIISSAANCEIDARDPQISRILREQGIKPGLGVRQGMPMSPVFANVLLRDFDRKIISKNFQMVRYADDFIIFCESGDSCYRADALARRELAKLQLSLPSLNESDSKTKIAAPE